MVDLYRVNEGGDWDSFWKAGVDVGIQKALVSDATEALERDDIERAVRLAGDFTGRHHEYPISYTDGSPLIYRPGTYDGLGDAALSLAAAMGRASKSYGRSVDGLVAAARLHRLCGDFARAKADAAKAAALDPDAAAPSFELATLQRIHSNRKAARKQYEHALAQSSDNDEMRLVYAGFLQQIGDYAGAAKIFAALAEKTGGARAYHGLAETSRMLGRHQQAIAAATRAVELAPNRHTRTALALCHIYAGQYDEGVADAEAGLAALPKSSPMVVAETAALGALDRANEVGHLTDFRRVIRTYSIATPTGWPDQASFNKALKTMVVKSEGRIFDPTQTNNMFLAPQGPFADLGKVIAEVVGHYARDLAESVPSPYFQSIPKSWSIDGWGTRLRVYKENEYHYHRHSWISGVYYASCPEDAIGTGTHEGWLEFCRIPPITPETLKAEVAAIPPREGMMVLFPSYFHHRILPFKAKDYRVSIAFNIIPDEGMA